MKNTMRIALTLAVTALIGAAGGAQAPRPTPALLATLLAGQPQGANAEAAAARLRTAFGADALSRGAAPIVDETSVAWAIQLPEAPGPGERSPRVASDSGGF